jgi:hypothetical protein
MQPSFEGKLATARRMRAEARLLEATADHLEAEVQEILAREQERDIGEPPCNHPRDALEDCSTMGRPQARCRRCGALIPLKAPLGGRSG